MTLSDTLSASSRVKRVVLIGVESTGKTTLAEDLADALQTEWVPEYGREYTYTKVGEWTTDDFIKIAVEQQRLENEAALRCREILICDTNALATGVWHERYMGARSPEVDALGDADISDLYILALADFPFVPDEIRDGELIRDEMHEWFVERLAEQPAPVILLGGSREERLKIALQEIASRFDVRVPTDANASR